MQIHQLTTPVTDMHHQRRSSRSSEALAANAELVCGLRRGGWIAPLAPYRVALHRVPIFGLGVEGRMCP